MSHNDDQNAKKETGHDPAMAWRLKTADKLDAEHSYILTKHKQCWTNLVDMGGGGGGGGGGRGEGRR